MNEAAELLDKEQLRRRFPKLAAVLDSALAAERRIMAAQIREAMKDNGGFEGENLDEILKSLAP